MRQWIPFLRMAASKVDIQRKRDRILSVIEGGDPLLACELIRRTMRSDDWRSLLRDEFGQVADPSELHRAILSLDQRITITTNFDKLLENAWASVKKNATHFPIVINSLDENVFRSLRDNESYIIKIHGSIDDIETLVFAKSDYNKYAFNHWAYGEFLRCILLTHTVVFIGFSMSDPAVSLAVEMYAHRFPSARPHYIFLADEDSDEICAISRDLRGLYVISYQSTNGHQELVGGLQSLAEASARRRREIFSAQ